MVPCTAVAAVGDNVILITSASTVNKAVSQMRIVKEVMIVQLHNILQ